MCSICAGMAAEFRETSLLEGGLVNDLAVSPAMRASNTDTPNYFLNVDERGGFADNGKTSLNYHDAGAQITRTGASWSGSLGQPATVTYAFRSTAPGTMPTDTTGFSRFTESQIVATELMLLAWSDVANITFERAGSGTSGEGAYSNSATMLFSNYADGQSGAAAFAYLAGQPGHNANSGDVWVNSSLAYNSNPLYMQYGYQVLLHEIGHAIGLSHPGDYNAGNGGPITYANSAQYFEDSRQYTVMSYFGATNTGGDHGGFYASAPLLDDIAAAQRLYGANTTTRTDDTVYGFNSTADREWYSAQTAQGAARSVIFAVWDAGGEDTFDFSGYFQGGVIDLRQGHFSSVGNLTGNVSIALGAVIENAIGGNGHDVIFGNSSDNRLTGGGGSDQIDGGLGDDTAIYSGARAAYTITYNGATVTVSGPDGTDTLVNVEYLQFADELVELAAPTAGIIVSGDVLDNVAMGTEFDDIIDGAGGDDVLNGLGGNDLLIGSVGDDVLNGGDGIDEADYSQAFGGVTIDLNLAGPQDTGGAGVDTLSSIENITGSTHNDVLTGDAGANVLVGNGGRDVLNGGGGDDVLEAGAGVLQGAEDIIKPRSLDNTSIANALNIDGSFDLMDDRGVANATTTPHATIHATGRGAVEYYAFTVGAGVTGRFDIDGASFDSYLYLYDANGTLLASNDDGGDTDGASVDSLITHTFATGGTYYIAVNRWVAGASADNPGPGVPSFGTYTLHVSIPGHAVVPIVAVGSELNGGDGDDTLISGSSSDTLDGGAGSDTAVFSGNRADYVIVQDGDVFTITGGGGTDTLTNVEFAQFADETVQLLGSVILTGDEDDNVLLGTDADEFLSGLGGNDVLYGMGGDDVLDGGAGGDFLIGGDGIDTGDWSAFSTQITANAATGYVFTGDGDYDWTSELEIYLLGSADDIFVSWAGETTVRGGDGHDWMADYGDSADLFHGEAGDDHLYGLAGDDELHGGAGIDLVIGGTGDDILIGGAGGDWMRGDEGADTFVFNSFDEIEWDTIAEFESGVDTIDLSGMGVSIVGAFTGVAGQMTITAGPSNDGYLQFDQDGDGWADHFIYVTGDLPTAGDFILGAVAAGSDTPLVSPLLEDEVVKPLPWQDEPVVCDAPLEDNGFKAPDTTAPVICEPEGVDLMAAMEATLFDGRGVHRLTSQDHDWIL